MQCSGDSRGAMPEAMAEEGAMAAVQSLQLRARGNAEPSLGG